jgi:type VI protein secretion system component Hcp
MIRLLRRWFAFASTPRPVTRPPARRTRLEVEVLDGRVLPSATPLLTGAFDTPGSMQPATVRMMAKASTLAEKTGQVHHQAHNLHEQPTKTHNHAKIHKNKHGHTPTVMTAPLSPSVPVSPANTAPAGLPTNPGTSEQTTYILSFGDDQPSTLPSSLSPIEVSSFQFGITNPVPTGATPTGAAAGKAQFMTMDVTMPVGNYSPILFSACVAGTHFNTVTLTEEKIDAAGHHEVVASWTMSTVFVTSDALQGGSNGSADPTEEIQLAFGAFRESLGTPGGKTGGNTVASWNQLTNSQDNSITTSS